MTNFKLDDLVLEKLNLKDVSTLIGWAQDEGWNPGTYDAEVFFATDPNGFYGFKFQGEFIAGGAVVSYRGAFGFMGLFLVKPAYRGLGLGKKLWFLRRDLLLSRLLPGASIGMDGVVAMQSFYQRGGFSMAFRDVRYVLTGFACEPDLHVQSIDDADFSSVLMYDSLCFGVLRHQFLRLWLDQPGSFCYKYVLNGCFCGYVVMRQAAKGYKIGPLFADNADVAEALYKTCLNAVAGEPVFLDIPLCNDLAVALVGNYNASSVFECARMYCGMAPKMNIDRIFGMTTFELG